MVVVETPEPASSALVLTVETAGICGSDLHMLGLGPSEVTLGHEFGGRLPDGRRVAVRPIGRCGSCDSCRGFRANLCTDAFARFQGGAIDGGFADRVAVDPDTVFPLYDAQTAGAAALVEPIAVAVHGVRRVDVQPGMSVAVVGAGSVGLATVAVLVDFGIDVDVEARYVHQQQAVEALGGRVGLEGRYDVVFDAVGSQSAFATATGACRSGADLVELGVFWDPVSMGADVVLREITIRPAVFYTHQHDGSDFQTAIDVLHRSPHIEDVMVTHRFSLDDAAEAFRVAADRRSGALKVHLVV
ncbi:MAG: alcohol dehydrogenase catalytic domain-containing protein [Actinomycetota bacterium]|nr:alcohol dehydrogenase catalytic domain-containing protein [Actinomycetota bacterium]MDA2970660.1 alcohol dehydrogenase catalytic domain-containing protein [Actinomycetota bacterium]MDA3000312.1 alcohol dehydrogenase catalytic domain-containing protein [Actinomycetota bacterium]